MGNFLSLPQPQSRGCSAHTAAKRQEKKGEDSCSPSSAEQSWGRPVLPIHPSATVRSPGSCALCALC